MFARDHSNDSVAIHLVEEADFESWCAAQSTSTRAWLTACLFRPERNRLALIPSDRGTLGAVIVGLGKQSTPAEPLFWIAASLPERLPEGRFNVVAIPDAALVQFAQGWAYGHYRFERYRKAATEKSQTLEVAVSIDLSAIERLNAGCVLARDLVNTPAADMSSADLAVAAVT